MVSRCGEKGDSQKNGACGAEKKTKVLQGNTLTFCQFYSINYSNL